MSFGRVILKLVDQKQDKIGKHEKMKHVLKGARLS